MFVDSSLSTFEVSHNLLKIEHPEIGNTCYGYQNSRTRCNLQGGTSSKVSFTLIHNLWTFKVDLKCNLDNLKLLELIFRHIIRETKTTNLYNYLRFCGNIMRSVGPNINLLSTEVTSMNTNGYVMQMTLSLLSFEQRGVLWVHMGAKLGTGGFIVMVILEIKTPFLLAYLAVRGVIAFPST